MLKLAYLILLTTLFIFLGSTIRRLSPNAARIVPDRP
jgi:hypothetical protein